MKILLVAINARYIHSNPAIHSLKAAALREMGLPEQTGAMPGTEPAFVTAPEQDGGSRVLPDDREMIPLRIETGEYTINHTTEAVRADIYRRRPEVLCFSCYIWNIRYVRELVIDLHRLLPETEIWLGGPEVSSHSERLLAELPEVQGIMVGPGEGTFSELVKVWRKRAQTYRHIPGLVYRDPAGVICGTGVPRRIPLDELPFRYDCLENRILYYESSRGCPFRCSYCLSSLDKQLEFRDTEKVKGELQFFLDRRVPQVKFVDRTFNCREDHALAIWSYLRDHDNGVTNFHFEIAADLLTEAELEVLGQLRPGQVQLEIGVQSTNPDTLREIRRTMDLQVLADRVARVRAPRNIHQHLDLIAGLPREDYASFGASFDAVYRMKPDQLQLGFLKVLPGTYMEEKAEEYGLLYTARPPYEVLSTRWLSYEEVLRLKGIEDALETYYNSGQFAGTLEALVGAAGSPFRFYERLAAFRRARGEDGVQSSRLRKYEVLWEFARQEDPAREALYRELLTRDCYLRENLRNRPSFAPPQRESDLRLWKDLLQTEAKRGQPASREAASIVGSGQNASREAASIAGSGQQPAGPSLADHPFPAGYEGVGYREMMNLLHCEVFREIPGAQGEGPILVIFDYRNRDPLTNNAGETVLARGET